MLAKSNVTVILLSIESMLLCINFMFILASLVLDDLFGIVLFFFLLCLAGAEASLGSSIPIVVYRLRGLISVDSLCYSKG